MTHIRRDGGWLCGGDRRRKSWRGYEGHISFTDAHRLQDMKHICGDCQKEYFRRLEKMNVVVDHVVDTPKKKRDNRVIQLSDELSVPGDTTMNGGSAEKESTNEQNISEETLKRLSKMYRILRGGY